MSLQKTYGQRQQTIAAGESAVLDARGMKGLKVILNGGTATYQECDEDGVVVPGSAAAAVSSGVLIDAEWSHYLVTAVGATCTACVV